MTFDIKATLEKIDSKRFHSQSASIVINPDNSGQLTIKQYHDLLETLEREYAQK